MEESKEAGPTAEAEVPLNPGHLEYKYASFPSGDADKLMRRHQRSPCSQWPWATQNKSNVLFGQDSSMSQEDQVRTALGLKKHVEFPWSHQHRSEAFDFAGTNPDMKNWKKSAKSMYTADYASSKGYSGAMAGKERIKRAGKPSKRSTQSLSGTNIRARSKAAVKGQGQSQQYQRWASKVVPTKAEKKSAGGNGDNDDEEQLQAIARLNLDDAIKNLRTEKSNVTNPFYHVPQKTIM